MRGDHRLISEIILFLICNLLLITILKLANKSVCLTKSIGSRFTGKKLCVRFN
jgi:hypothetical protein